MRRVLAVTLGAAALALLPVGAAEAHPLGNFTVNTADRLVVVEGGLEVTHVVDLAEIPTVQLSQDRAGVDGDGDGRLSATELTAHARRECARTLPRLEVEVDGRPARLTLEQSSATSRPGAAGLATTRLTCEYRTPTRPRSSVAFADTAAGDRNGWREVTAASACGPLRSSTVPTESPSGLLTSYPADLLQSPVDVTSARIGVRAGASCAATSATASVPDDAAAPRGLDRLSQGFTDFLSRPDLTLAFAVLSLAASVLFGVLHALAPGHGKTVMAAYLVGQRGTRRQAVQLGAVVTFTHTASVLLLGAVLALGALAAPELVVPATEVLSGVLLVGVGAYLLVLALRRWSVSPLGHAGSNPRVEVEPGRGGGGQGGGGPRSHRHSDHHHAPGDRAHHDDGHRLHDHHHHDDQDHGHQHDGHHDHDHDQDHDHDHDHDHGSSGPLRAATTTEGGGLAVATRPLTHSHGGRAHTHAALPEGPLSWRSLVAMGVAGGLVPSPSALLVLLSATALGRAWFGVLLVLAYGVGMAVTLTAAGLLLLRARAALDRRGWSLGRGRSLVRLLPLGTAGIVVVVGLALVLRGVATGRGLL